MSDVEKQAVESPVEEQGEEKKKWTEIAEFRMVLYVVPVAIVLILLAWLLS
ncbi:MAG TPA: hypothetical protein VFF68_04585 [Anaerolineaceae bacterium]|nr:hypothetical protein [Anaerolineaceae bacterium]